MNTQDDAISTGADSATGTDSPTEADSAATTGSESTDAEPKEFKLSIEVSIDEIGPCKRHVRITIPRADLEHVYSDEVDNLVANADIPGFRPGHVPKNLIKKRLRKELDDKVKNRLLMDSLEILSDEKHLDPINEPNLDVDNIEIPDDGDFEYEFDVEVRPEFDIPEYAGLKIRRPVKEITELEVDLFLERFLSQYGELEVRDEATQPGDYVTLSVDFSHGGKSLRKLSDLTVQVKPVLQFSDAELSGFDELIDQAAIGDTREADLTISSEAESIEMRGESVHAVFKVTNVRRMKMPEMNSALLNRVGVESEDELRDTIRDTLERQAVYQQRQAVREQVLDKITESADWEL
ncbi:MAG: trigger factor, partial [Planctomycetes bacterium]|nr:trigger factor [Planctomycetota bacterium]